MTRHDDHGGRPLDGDALDDLLRDWHQSVRDRARDARSLVLEETPRSFDVSTISVEPSTWRTIMTRYTPIAAAIGLVLYLTSVLVPGASPVQQAFADQLVQVPEGGRLAAFDRDGAEIGPCPLQHTDVDVSVSAHVVRVNLVQTYKNPYDTPIEAVYTFPLGEDAAVDRMRMIVRDAEGERIVIGEVRERNRARQMYESARDAGYVASLLEQERPNIFTQSVANITPGATVEIHIGYVELLDWRDGEFEFDFPTVVGPRYIPGSSSGPRPVLPEAFDARRGIVLRAPAGIDAIELGENFDADAARLLGFLDGAKPIADPFARKTAATSEAPNDEATPTDDEPVAEPTVLARFTVRYADGSAEPAVLLDDGSGVVAGRWFCWHRPVEGGGFAPPTDQVPDADRITPMPVHPSTRAGHDISISVQIDTGGPAITSLESVLHRIEEVAPVGGRGGAAVTRVTLGGDDEIPNRDFVLRWTVDGDSIAEAALAHTRPTVVGADGVDGYVTLVLNPPARVAPEAAVPRELVFVLDVSGSMRGFPLERSKELVRRAIAGMRDRDTFNVITFAGHTAVLWDKARPATDANRAAATTFIDTLQGGGGTEMMNAIRTALSPDGTGGRLDVNALVNLPADGRTVRVRTTWADLTDDRALTAEGGIVVPVELNVALPTVLDDRERRVHLDGSWVTKDGRRVLMASAVSFADEPSGDEAMRVVVFLTDGYVGNDHAIIAAVKEFARTTRVFSFGVGDSTNRYLLEGMANAGRGAVEYLAIAEEGAEKVERLYRRLETPVLADVSVTFGEGLEVFDVVPSGGLLPDLWDEAPLVIRGRYAKPGRGEVTITGRTGAGEWTRTLTLELDANEPDHDVVPALWARAKVDSVLADHLQAVQNGMPPNEVREAVVALGERYSIMTPYTSFVAIEKSRVVVNGRPMLVRVPIELPSGTDWTGFFGENRVVEREIAEIALGRRPDRVELFFAATDDVIATDGPVRLDEDARSPADAPATRPAPRESARYSFGLEATNESLGQPIAGQAATRSSKFARGVPMPSAAAPPPPARGGRGQTQTLGGLALESGGAPRARTGGALGGGGGGSGKGWTAGEVLADELSDAEASDRAISEGETGAESTDAGDSETTSEPEAPALATRTLDEAQLNRLVRTLERDLALIALHSVLTDEVRAFLMLPDASGLDETDAGILVSIRLTPDAKTDDVRVALEALGVTIVGADPGGTLLVARLPRAALLDVGLHPSVARVVSTRLSKDAAGD